MTTAPAWTDDVEPEPPRYADESAEEIEDTAVASEPDTSRLPADRFLDRTASWLQFNERVLELAADPDGAAARAGALRARSSPATSTSSSWCGWPRCAAGWRPVSRPPARRVRRPRNASTGSPGSRTTSSTGRRRLVTEELLPATGRGRPCGRALGRPRGRRAEATRRPVHRADPPRPHAAGRRPGAPVPVHLRAVPQPRRRRRRRGHRRRALRPGEGAAAAPPAGAGRRGRHPAGAARGRHRCAPRPGLPRHGRHGGVLVPGDPQRGPRGRRRRRQPAARPRARAVAPPLRCPGPARDRRRDERPRPRPAGARARDHRRRGLPERRAARPVGALGRRRDAIRGRTCAPRRSRRETHPALQRRRAARVGDVFAALRGGDVLLHHPYDSFATSVQAFIEQAASGPRGARPQAHALPHQRRVAHRRRPRRRRPRPASRCSSSWRSRRASTSRPTSGGRASSSRPAATSSTGWSASRRTASWPSSCGPRPTAGCVATSTSAPATTTRRPPAIYEDLGLLTADPAVGADVADLFNHLSGYTRHRDYDTLLVAPDDLRAGLLALIAPRDPPGRARASPQASRSRSTAWSTRPSSTRSTTRRGPASPSTCWSAACARCAPAYPACPRRSGCAACSAGSSSTRGSTGSSPAATTRCCIGSADLMDRNLDRRVEALVRVQRPGEPPRDRPPARDARGATTSTTGRCPPTASGPGHRAVTRPGRPAEPARRASAGRLTVVGAGDAQVEAAGGVLWRGDPTDPEVASCTVRGTTTGRCPRASSTSASTRCSARCARSRRRPGARARPGRRLGSLRYAVPEGPKRVRYWACEAVGGDFTANREVDELCWLPVSEAFDLLSPTTTAESSSGSRPTPGGPARCVVVRHASAGDKKGWTGSDADRPLDADRPRPRRLVASLLRRTP